MGTTQSIPKDSPLGRVLERWYVHGRKPMTKKKMISYCNKVWPTYVLGSEERWPLNGSLNYYTILQLESFCKRSGKWGELSYIEAFMWLHKMDAAREGNVLTVPCGRSVKPPQADSEPKPPPADRKTQKGEKNEETPPSASQNPGTQTARQGGGRIPPPPPPRSREDLGNPGTRAATAPPSRDEQTVSPSRTSQGTQYGRGAPPPQSRGDLGNPGTWVAMAPPSRDEQTVSPSRTSQGTQCGPGAPQTGVVVPYQPRQLPVGGVDPKDQPTGYYWARTPFSVSDLLKWKTTNPSYREDPQKTTDFFTFIFSTHQPNWADVEALLNILLTSDERKLVREKALEEAYRLYRENPYRTPSPAGAVPLVEPHWNPNGGGLVHLEHYRRCILEGLKRGVTKKNCPERVRAVQQKLDEDPEDFLQRLYQAYRKYTNIDPEAPENVWQVSLSFIFQSAPSIRRKLETLNGALAMNPEQLVSIARAHSRRMEPQQQIVIFLNPGGGREETKRRRPLGPNQCAYCKKEGHWKKECPRLLLKEFRNALQNQNGMVGWHARQNGRIGWHSDSDEDSD
uniref:CCHC-type domain-containing protein n=1 Tax=Pipistrellus kuhlii TaxID=59472 RepID=A0A7J7TA67_PIPKU|nr:hypothetical protein mPipKuh1_009684 [Pipistrellus kuhlii]